MRTLLVSLTLLSLTIFQPVSARSISTGSELQDVCNDVEHFSECVGYLEVVYWTAKAIARMNAPGSNRVIGSCGPEQGIDTVPLPVALRTAWRDHAASSPARLRNLAVEEALLAFEQRWPCER